MTSRKFHKYVVEIEILSETPWTDEELYSLETIRQEITEGSCSGDFKVKQHKILNGTEVAKALMKQGSDPEFFMIDKKGNDINDNDE